MTTFVNPKLWQDGEAITAAELNKLGQALVTLFNVTKLSGSNLQTATVSPANLVNPYTNFAVSLRAQEPGAGHTTPGFSGGSGGWWDAYQHDLDEIRLEKPAILIGWTVKGCGEALPAGHGIKLFKNGLEVVASEITAIPSMDDHAAHQSQNVNLLAGDVISIRTTGGILPKHLPVVCKLFFKTFMVS